MKRELKDEIDKFVIKRNKKYYLKKGTFLFHGSLDENLLENLKKDNILFSVGSAEGGVYFGLDPEISLWYIQEAAALRYVKELINSKQFNKFYKKYKKQNLEKRKKEIEKLTLKFMEPFGYLYSFKTSKEIEIEVLPETQGPAGEYCGLELPCFQIQRTIRDDSIEDRFVEIFVQLYLLENLDFFKMWKIDAKCLYKNRGNPNFDPKKCLI